MMRTCPLLTASALLPAALLLAACSSTGAARAESRGGEITLDSLFDGTFAAEGFGP